MDSRYQSGLATAGWIGAVIALLAVIQYLQSPDQRLAWVALFDAGHAPLFGAIALAVFCALGTSPLGRRRSRRSLYLLALGISVVLGMLSEWVQLAASRNQDPWDVLHDTFGAGAFLLFAASFDPQAIGRSKALSRNRTLFRGAALLLLALTFIPVAKVGSAYAQRAAAFPLLCDFNGTWERRFLGSNHAGLELVSLPNVNTKGATPAWRIRFEPAHFSAFKLLEPYPDWTGYQTLLLVLHSQQAQPIDLVVRIHDRRHDDRPTDRFERGLAITPGTNAFSIPLTEIRQAPESREMNMAAIARLNLYVVEPRDELELNLLELRLQ